MAIVIMNNNKVYVMHKEDGELKKTLNESEAEDFKTLQNAIECIWQNPDKVSGYYVFDTVTERVCYRWKVKKEKKSRKVYPKSTRKLIYNNANGRCNLCGRKILYKNMSLDHIIPLSMGGADNETNLSCTCKPCNNFKRNMLPDDFFETISLIYLYQMEKKYKERMRWKIVHGLLSSLIQSN